MTCDLENYRTANILIREHGEEAGLVAAQRADSFLEAGDVDGCSVWKRVLKAIKYFFGRVGASPITHRPD